MTTQYKSLLLILIIGVFGSCATTSGSGGSSGSSDPAGTEASGAAVAAIFSSGDSALLKKSDLERLAALIIKDAHAQAEGAGERDTCDDPDDDGEADGPQEIDSPLTGTAGTYGDTNGTTTTLTDDHVCLGSDGAENTGTGPDGNGLFASFTLEDTITGTCDDGTIEMTAGTGVWRNTDDSFPEVYGTFTINGTEVSCTMYLNENQTVRDGSSCSAGGETVDMDVDQSCTLSTVSDEDDESTDDGSQDDQEDGEGDEED
jgi:hypothetical protein